jgi:uncharacterized membrane protein (UPF0127 family)
VKRTLAFGAWLVLAISGCTERAPALPVVHVKLDTRSGPRLFTVELASNFESQQHGLMNRRQLAPDGGMLFDFRRDASQSFWMKDTYLPLDMLFIRSDGTISSIVPNAVPLSTTPIRSAEPVRAVLEINGGKAIELGIASGDQVHAAIFHNER